MKRFSAFVIGLVMLVSACSGGVQYASVGDASIDDAYIGRYIDAAALPAGAEFRDLLFRFVALEIIGQGFDEATGGDLDPDAVAAQLEALQAQVDEAGGVPQVLGVTGANDALLEYTARTLAIRDAMRESLVTDGDFIAEAYGDGLGFAIVCVRHILVETVDEATVVRDRLEAGEDFAAVATEVSLDTGTPGGDLGCAAASRYVPEFATASFVSPIGDLIGPVQTDFGHHLLIVDDRTVPSLADIQADPLSYISFAEADGLWQQWFNDRIREADVVVNETYGTWVPEGPGIAPPE